ncbi:MAG: dynamin family protein [Woeseia sp.]
MTENTRAGLQEHVNKLVNHIQAEHPELLGVVQSFRRLDKVAYSLGLLDRTRSYVTRIPWWPLISVLGTFSSGKSTFINQLLGQPLQKTGNQAVDDKFTVLCYSPENTPRVLPGIALDSDPRFPFYRISREINKVIEGEGQRLDSYLQLKTCSSEQLRGKIVIDSPGFDADAQRTSTLRITDHIINLSDLVLVFFDARHPEPGAMRDTLDYLVSSTLQRPDFNKFLHILNQIDNAAREDNPEEVFAAWQRALAQKGLTAGRFYRIYDPDAAMPIEDEHLKQRFESKRDEDMAEILHRIAELEVERSYRAVGKLEHTAKSIREQLVPRLREARRAWRRRVLLFDGLAFGGLFLLLLVITGALGYWEGVRFRPPWIDSLIQNPLLLWAAIAVIVLAAVQLHRYLRNIAGRMVLKKIRQDKSLGDSAGGVAEAFHKNVRSWWPFVFTQPVGWNVWTRRQLDSILNEAYGAVQELNDRYTDPSGSRSPDSSATPAV